jgi:hypothetical protein
MTTSSSLTSLKKSAAAAAKRLSARHSRTCSRHGKSFGNSEQSIAIWEKTSKVPLWADKHIRVLWTAAHAANTPVKALVERLNTVERLINQKIVLHDTRRGWRVQASEATAV